MPLPSTISSGHSILPLVIAYRPNVARQAAPPGTPASPAARKGAGLTFRRVPACSAWCVERRSPRSTRCSSGQLNKLGVRLDAEAGALLRCEAQLDAQVAHADPDRVVPGRLHELFAPDHHEHGEYAHQQLGDEIPAAIALDTLNRSMQGSYPSRSMRRPSPTTTRAMACIR